MEQKTKEKIQWQCNVNTSERTCILRPDHAKKSTQQSLCINLVRRRSTATLGNLKLNCCWHCFTRVLSDVLNSFINSRFCLGDILCFKAIQQDWDAFSFYEL